ncbi:hypothetical protein [Photobacterium carnosum]|uniref:hypothetical protein n=1 Tax=Photobacterium carnosum TaxID=2023717 RepID=UPI001E442837|nr:hypothetical protein [Photobacterium carnosum]MCD9495588.1 hypothetical protein [Photobacterium carnosum]
MPKVPAVEMLKDLMDIAPQSVISDILNGKRDINLAQAKGFSVTKIGHPKLSL